MKQAVAEGEMGLAQKAAAQLEAYEDLLKDLAKDSQADGPGAERVNPASVEAEFRHPHRRRNGAAVETSD